jgi:DNA invertase Pin-like site-specific DNA recombinase
VRNAPYARVSTTDQDVSGQIARLKEAGAVRVFEDVVSGTQFDRPGLSALLDHARPGDSRAITRLDRLEERIDTTSAAGELIFHVFGAIAHFDRRLISERIKDGIQATRMRGKKPGRPPLYPEAVLALQNLVQAGMTAGQAAKQLGIARSTAYRLIKETTET